MKLKLRSLLLLLLLLAGLLPLAALAADSKAAKEDAKADYPLQICVVSDEKMDHGEPYQYIHKEAGKPDRLVLLCCEGCVDDFKKEPAKYIAKLDAAAKAKSAAKPADSAQQKAGPKSE
jgi:hypothetical protein